MSEFNDNEIHCPRCAHVLEDRRSCPFCGYTGYIPMSKKQTRRIKWILTPIILVAAIALYFIFR